MLFTPKNAVKIAAGTKWQTRRLARVGDVLFGGVVRANGRVRYRVGQTYAIQPGRGKKAICRRKLVSVRLEAVHDITNDDAVAEGCTDIEDFLALWHSIHPQSTLQELVWVLEFERGDQPPPLKQRITATSRRKEQADNDSL
jgi:hypothetical protein